MAIFKCDLVQKRVRANTTNDGASTTFTATARIPAGIVIALNDEIEISDLAAKHTVESVRVFTDDLDDATTMAWDVGYKQLAPGTGYGGTNASGFATDFDTATGTVLPSPATSAAYFQTGATFGRAKGWSSLTLANTGDPEGLGGPVRITAKQTAATPTQTVAATVDRVLRFEFTIARATPVARSVVDMGGY